MIGIPFESQSYKHDQQKTRATQMTYLEVVWLGSLEVAAEDVGFISLQDGYLPFFLKNTTRFFCVFVQNHQKTC